MVLQGLIINSEALPSIFVWIGSLPSLLLDIIISKPVLAVSESDIHFKNFALIFRINRCTLAMVFIFFVLKLLLYKSYRALFYVLSVTSSIKLRLRRTLVLQ